jgi:hypothetical protein
MATSKYLLGTKNKINNLGQKLCQTVLKHLNVEEKKVI